MIKKLIIFIATFTITFALSPILADNPGMGPYDGDGINTTTTCRDDQVDSLILGCRDRGTNFDSSLIVIYVNTIFGWGVGVIGSVAMLALIYAGFKYITSNGNPDDIKLAKEIVVTAITSIVLVVFSYAIFKLLGLVS